MSRHGVPSRRYRPPQSTYWVGTEVKSKERGKREGLLSGPTFYAHHSPSVDTFLLALTLGSRVGHMIQVWPIHVFFFSLGSRCRQDTDQRAPGLFLGQWAVLISFCWRHLAECWRLLCSSRHYVGRAYLGIKSDRQSRTEEVEQDRQIPDTIVWATKPSWASGLYRGLFTCLVQNKLRWVFVPWHRV